MMHASQALGVACIRPSTSHDWVKYFVLHKLSAAFGSTESLSPRSLPQIRMEVKDDKANRDRWYPSIRPSSTRLYVFDYLFGQLRYVVGSLGVWVWLGYRRLSSCQRGILHAWQCSRVRPPTTVVHTGAHDGRIFPPG